MKEKSHFEFIDMVNCIGCVTDISLDNTGRFIMSTLITNSYNKKTEGLTIMELFTATGKLKSFFFF